MYDPFGWVDGWGLAWGIQLRMGLVGCPVTDLPIVCSLPRLAGATLDFGSQHFLLQDIKH